MIKDQKYFTELAKYILNNPVRKGLVSKPEQWEFSSTRDYFGIRKGTINDMEAIRNQFKNIEEFKYWVKGEKQFDSSLFY